MTFHKQKNDPLEFLIAIPSGKIKLNLIMASRLTIICIFVICLVMLSDLNAEIKIMPLGDSITHGVGPSLPDEDLNGYRLELLNLLTSSGFEVDFVGGLEHGTFIDKQHEGHRGWRDFEIASNIYNWLVNNPADIILLHIGTNDLDESPDDVEVILDEIDRWEIDSSRTVIVILAKIINQQGHVCPDPSTTTTFNSNVEQMALARINDLVNPDRIIITDMECSAGIDYQLHMVDELHPNETGYTKMANKWYLDGLLTILPLAHAGIDQTVEQKTSVTLDGSGSIDPDGASLNYLWNQISTGAIATLSDPTAENPIIITPEVGPNGENLTFKLTVTDVDGFMDSDTVNILVTRTGAGVSGQNPVENASDSGGGGGACFVTTIIPQKEPYY